MCKQQKRTKTATRKVCDVNAKSLLHRGRLYECTTIVHHFKFLITNCVLHYQLFTQHSPTNNHNITQPQLIMTSETFQPRPAEVNSAKTVCKCGGSDSVCGCAPGQCTCASCPKSSNPVNKAVPAAQANKTVCQCGGNEGTCVSTLRPWNNIRLTGNRPAKTVHAPAAAVPRTIKAKSRNRNLVTTKQRWVEASTLEILVLDMNRSHRQMR